MPVISFYEWIIQFLNDNSEIGKAGKIIHDDPDFPKEISNYETFRKFVKEHYAHLDISLIRNLRSSYRVYERSIQA